MLHGTLPGAVHHSFILDGQPHTVPCGDTVPPERCESNVRWLRDSDGLEGTENKAKIRWSVSPDGQRLTIDTVWPNGRHDVYIYNRKND